MTDLTPPDQSARTATGCPERMAPDTRGLWDMAGPAQRGSRERGQTPRRASSARSVGAVSTVGRGSAATTRKRSASSTEAPPEKTRPQTRSTYRSLVTRGFAPDEAASLTAFLVRDPDRGRPLVAPPGQRVVVPPSDGPGGPLRILRRRSDPAPLITHPPRSSDEALFRQAIDQVEAAPNLLPAPLRRSPGPASLHTADGRSTLGTIRRCAPSSRSSPTSGRPRPPSAAG
jgi:hypothetical protein